MTAKTLDNFAGAVCEWIGARRLYLITNGRLLVNGEIAAPPGGWGGVTVLITRASGSDNGGGIIFGDGAEGTVGDDEVPVLFIEDQFALARAADNYKKNATGGIDNAGAGARFAGGPTNRVIFDNVHWFVDTRTGRSDFDIAQGDSSNNGPAITFRGLRLFITSGANHSFNHIASKNAKIEIGSNVDYGLWITDTVNPASLELSSGLVNRPDGIILDDTYPGSGHAQFAVQPGAMPENGWLEVYDLKARSVSVVSGGTNTDTRGLRFINLVGLPERKAWSNAYDGNLEVQRDQRFEFDNATDGRVYADAQHASSEDVDEPIDSSGVSTLRLITQVSGDSFVDWTSTNTFKFHAVGYSFQKYYSGDTAITIANDVPAREVSVVKDEFPNGDAVSARSGTDAIATASDLYRVLKGFEIVNPAVPSLSESIAKINSEGHLVIGDSIDLVLSSTASDLIAHVSGTITVKTDSNGITADKGISLLDIGTTNTMPAGTRDLVKMPVKDSTGTSSQLTITAHANERVGVWSSDGATELGSHLFDADGSITFQITAANSTSGIGIGLVRKGYIYADHTIDLSAGGAFSVAVNALLQEIDPDNEPLYDSSLSTDGIPSVSFAGNGQAKINIGNAQVRAHNIYKKFHDELDTTAGTRFAAFSRRRLAFSVDPLNGDNLYLGPDIQLRRADAGDDSATVLASVRGGIGGDLVDTANGDIIIKAGTDLSRIQQALLKDFDLDPSEIGTQSVAGLMVRAARFAETTAGIVGGKSTVVKQGKKVRSATFRDLADTKDVRTITYGDDEDGARTASVGPSP